MNAFEQILFLGIHKEGRPLRYILDALLAIVASLAVTLIIYVCHLYPRIPNISFLYLLIVLGCAVVRGLYAAVIASIVAFLTFDFFAIHPLYAFTINSPEEWLALGIFLITAIITGQLASALRQRAEQATIREREARALYELVNAATNEDNLERQLDVVAHAIVSNFSSVGVVDCAILLPDAHGRLTLQADAQRKIEDMNLSPDEKATAQSVLTEGRIIDLYSNPLKETSSRFRRIVRSEEVEKREKASQPFVRFIPLQQGKKVVGVARLSMTRGSYHFSPERRSGMESSRLEQPATFFWTFLDQAASMIERARLHQEAVQIELLRRTDALRSALLSSVSHDLRTPLASIKAAASSLLQEDVEWDEETKRSFARAIERETDRLNRLVGNLLDMSRIEGGALKAEKEWYSIDEVIHDVLGRMQAMLQGREIKLSIPDGLPPVALDYLQIDQVITNLLENAIRYTPAGSSIGIDIHVMEGEIVVSIADHGSGIPPADLERIFDKFYRVSGEKRKTTSIMGTGLGLAVCRGLIEAHGGTIWAENRPTGGAIFRFTLPLSEGREEKEQDVMQPHGAERKNILDREG